MMRSFLLHSALFSFLVCICCSCSSSETNTADVPSEITAEDINGYWQLVSAHRDGKSTKVLDNTFFEFSKDSMQTNLPSKEGRYPYKTLRNEIVTKEPSSPTFYKVKSISGDTLIFSVKLRDYLFEMTLALQDSDDKESEDL